MDNPALKVGHIYTTVHDKSLIGNLKKLLRVKHPNYDKIIKNDIRRGIHKYTDESGKPTWDGYIRFLKYSKSRGYYFLSGLVPLVLDDWSKSSWDDFPEDKILWPDYEDIEISEPDLGDFQLRDYQKEAFVSSLEKHRGILHLATNSGKTLIAAAITKTLDKPALFMVHRKTLLAQTYEMFLDFFDESELGMLGDGIFEPNKFTIATVQTISNHFKGKKKKIPHSDIEDWFNEVDILFFDECHTTGNGLGLQTVGTNCPARYRYGLSGTPVYKSDLDTFSLIGITGPVIARTTNEELIEEGYSAEPVVCMMDISNSEELRDSMKWPEVEEHAIIHNDSRNDKIVEIVKMAKQNGLPAVILIKKIRHGDKLRQRLDKAGISNTFVYGDSSTEERKDAMKGLGDKYDTIIASVILEEGVNIPQMKVLVLAGGGKSKRSALQSIGRVLRRSEEGEDKVYIFDFYDDAHRYVINHTLGRAKHYMNENFTLVDGYPTDFKEGK